ncbi:MAG: phosphate ABC transporter substrate-binding protein [Burkholderiales bacterium]|nr:phosphate ABC transporter substrate-binding protein [Burkholderiales bacterium]
MKKQMIATTLLLVASYTLTIADAQAEIVLVVNKANTQKLSDEQVTEIFLGKSKAFPNGAKAVPVMVDFKVDGLDAFLSARFGKSISQYRSYWSRLMFSGEGVPPQTYGSAKDVIDLVGRNPDLIGIADSSMVNDSVRVLMR